MFTRFEENYSGLGLERYALQHDEIPLIAVSAYLMMVFCLPTILSRWGLDATIAKSRALQRCIRGWNLLLAIFSSIGAVKVVPFLVEKLYTEGWRYTVCQEPTDGFYLNGSVGFWISLFVLSKFPELLDTLFLVLQGKPVIFLHWFHHATVLLYAWHSCRTRASTGLWFASMNYCVHSVMYLYFFLMTFSKAPALRRSLRRYGHWITYSQIAQMVMGLIVSVSAGFYRELSSQSCVVAVANYRMAVGMYTSYFVLFSFLLAKRLSSSTQKSMTSNGGTCPPNETEICQSTGTRPLMDARRRQW